MGQPNLGLGEGAGPGGQEGDEVALFASGTQWCSRSEAAVKVLKGH